MDKIDIIGYKSADKNSNDVDSKLNRDDHYTNTNINPASKFAAFVRNQTKSNDHLNMYSKDISLKGLRDVTNMKMFRFDKLKKEEITAILGKCVSVVTDNIVVLNKPNGIAVQDGTSQSLSITEIIDDLSKELGMKNLYVVHRLDKDTTGVLLLARNPETSFLLKDAFKRGQIRKNYLCLTHGIPHPNEGIIDFSLKEQLVDGNVMIRPDLRFIMKREKLNEKPATISTAYKILCSNYNVALVQCAMLSGVKHQIRAHLAYGLETPVLGDHKYSWFLKSKSFPILPQQLTPPALAGLQIEPEKTRHLPIHLHSHQIIIGEPSLPASQFDGKANLNSNKVHGSPCRLANETFYANLPPFFVKNLKLLKLYDFRMLKNVLTHIL